MREGVVAEAQCFGQGTGIEMRVELLDDGSGRTAVVRYRDGERAGRRNYSVGERSKAYHHFANVVWQFAALQEAVEEYERVDWEAGNVW